MRVAVLLPLLLMCTSCISRAPVLADEKPDAKAEIAVYSEGNTALLGRLFPTLRRLFQRSRKRFAFVDSVRSVEEHVDFREVSIYASIGWGLVPLTRGVYEVVANVTGRQLISIEDKVKFDDKEDLLQQKEGHSDVSWPARIRSTFKGADAEEATRPKRRFMKAFKDTLLYQVVNLISEASRLGMHVISFDCVTTVLHLMGFNPFGVFDSNINLAGVFSSLVYSGWIVNRTKSFKRYLLEHAFGVNEEADWGKMELVDNLGNGLLYATWGVYILNTLEIQTGIAVKSLFSLGATGTLVFSLASKDIASQIMSGLTLHLSDKIYQGDSIELEDGTSGIVEDLGWMQTLIKGGNDMVTALPNTAITNQRIYNLSRTPRSQVKQELRVSYTEAANIPNFLAAIKEEIKKSCPKLVTDGSSPFRAHWTDYGEKYLMIVVNAHFYIKPTGNEYWDNRQQVLEAILRAATKTEVHLEKACKPATSAWTRPNI